jgi:hypothetical protein
MIVWLNGPFGIGKTTTARALVRRLEGALLYDPEIVGGALRQMVVEVDAADDFQDLRAWRRLVVESARVLRTTYDRTLVVPMTVWRGAYLAELADGFRSIDPDLHCLRLTAPEAALRARILGRPEEEGPHDWALGHLAEGLELMHDPRAGEEVVTADRTPDEIADDIAVRLGR